jgi:hypothetical protein
MRTYVNCRMEALLSKVTVGTTSTSFLSRPLAATTNIGVVTRAVDADGHESKYYGVIKNIIKYRFARNKNLKTVFFDCDWFDPYHGTRENNFGMVEVKHTRRLRGCDPFVLAHQVD